MVGVYICCVPSHPRGHKVPSHFNFLYEGIFCFFFQHPTMVALTSHILPCACLKGAYWSLNKTGQDGEEFLFKAMAVSMVFFSYSLSKGRHGGICCRICVLGDREETVKAALSYGPKVWATSTSRKDSHWFMLKCWSLNDNDPDASLAYQGPFLLKWE